MYLILTASKDTYVTNRKLNVNDGRYANVGKASSLDLFKLQSENKLVKPQAEILVKSIPSDGNSFTLNDSNGNAQTYTYKNGDNDPASKFIGLNGITTIAEIVNGTYTKISKL